MGVLNEAAKQAIEAGPLGHLVTIGPSGAPQVSIVWVGVEGDELVVGHLGSGHKIANIERDARVAVSFETEGANPVGMRNYLVVHGTARLEPGGAPELLSRLAQVYVGPGTRFLPMDDPPPGNVIRITPERVHGQGPWEG